MVPAGRADSRTGARGLRFREWCLMLCRPDDSGHPHALPGGTLVPAGGAAGKTAQDGGGGDSSRRERGTPLKEREDSARQKMMEAPKMKGSPQKKGGEERAQSEGGRI